jgi:hypothetical protein
MIYGANGYTGQLVAVEATRRGLNPVLAGRRAGPIERWAAETQLPAPVFDLGDAAAAAVALAGDNDKPATASAEHSFGSALCRYVCEIPGTASVRRSVGVCDMTPPTFYARSAIKRRFTDRSERS